MILSMFLHIIKMSSTKHVRRQKKYLKEGMLLMKNQPWNGKVLEREIGIVHCCR